MPTIRKVDQEFKIYVPLSKGLSMMDLVNVCKEAAKEEGLASSLHPIKRRDKALAVVRPEACPVTTQDVWKIRLCSIYNIGARWPWFGPGDDWKTHSFEEEFIKPISPDDDICRGPGKKKYRTLSYSCDEAERMRQSFFRKKRYSEVLSKRHNCWIVKVSIYPDDCPRDVVDSVKSAFDRAGFGKPIC